MDGRLISFSVASNLFARRRSGERATNPLYMARLHDRDVLPSRRCHEYISSREDFVSESCIVGELSFGTHIGDLE